MDYIMVSKELGWNSENARYAFGRRGAYLFTLKDAMTKDLSTKPAVLVSAGFSAIDEPSQKALREKLKELRSENKTTSFSVTFHAVTFIIKDAALKGGRINTEKVTGLLDAFSDVFTAVKLDPRQCVLCEKTGAEETVLRGGMAVPVHAACLKEYISEQNQRETAHQAIEDKRYGFGLAGAVLFSLLGGALFTLGYQLLWPAPLWALLIGLGAWGGYYLFGGKKGANTLKVCLFSAAVGVFAEGFIYSEIGYMLYANWAKGLAYYKISLANIIKLNQLTVFWDRIIYLVLALAFAFVGCVIPHLLTSRRGRKQDKIEII